MRENGSAHREQRATGPGGRAGGRAGARWLRRAVLQSSMKLAVFQNPEVLNNFGKDVSVYAKGGSPAIGTGIQRGRTGAESTA